MKDKNRTFHPLDISSFLARNTEMASALTSSQIVNNMLTMLLQKRLPNLKKRLRRSAESKGRRESLERQLFRNYGPLSTFSAQIDMAFGLDLIDRKMAEELHTVRSIRNKFAHSEGGMDFTHPDIKALLTRFDNFEEDKNGVSVFMDKTGELINQFSEKIGTQARSNALIAALNNLSE